MRAAAEGFRVLGYCVPRVRTDGVAAAQERSVRRDRVEAGGVYGGGAEVGPGEWDEGCAVSAFSGAEGPVEGFEEW